MFGFLKLHHSTITLISYPHNDKFNTSLRQSYHKKKENKNTLSLHAQLENKAPAYE